MTQRKRESMSTIANFNIDAGRRWFAAGASKHDVICGVIIAGKTRWLKASIRNGSVAYLEHTPPVDPKKLKPAKPELVEKAEASLHRFARGAGLSNESNAITTQNSGNSRSQ